jgi:photosystem II stability/assembly factor-like uncharacterized protein
VKIFRTSDGGKHWMQVACTAFSSAPASFGCHRRSGIDLGGDKDTLRFQNLLDGWLTSFSNWGVPDLYHTSNGGTTWQRQAVHPSGARNTPRGSSFGTYGSLKIFGRTGLLSETISLMPAGSAAGSERLYVHRSVDGGQSWRYLQQTPLRAGAVRSALPTQFVNALHWIVQTPATVWSTSNAGTRWSHRPVQVPPGLQLLSEQFTGPQTGWAMAQPSGTGGGIFIGAALLRTIDGGADWSRVALP